MLQQSLDALVGLVSLAPVQPVEPSPLVQFEPRSVFLPPERIIGLHAVLMGVRQVVLPAQKVKYVLVLSSEQYGHACFGGMPPGGCFCRAFAYILLLDSTPALGARHLLSVVTSFS